MLTTPQTTYVGTERQEKTQKQDVENDMGGKLKLWFLSENLGPPRMEVKCLVVLPSTGNGGSNSFNLLFACQGTLGFLFHFMYAMDFHIYVHGCTVYS